MTTYMDNNADVWFAWYVGDKKERTNEEEHWGETERKKRREDRCNVLLGRTGREGRGGATTSPTSPLTQAASTVLKWPISNHVCISLFFHLSFCILFSLIIYLLIYLFVDFPKTTPKPATFPTPTGKYTPPANFATYMTVYSNGKLQSPFQVCLSPSSLPSPPLSSPLLPLSPFLPSFFLFFC